MMILEIFSNSKFVFVLGTVVLASSHDNMVIKKFGSCYFISSCSVPFLCFLCDYRNYFKWLFLLLVR